MEQVCAAFDKVAVVLNVGGVVDVSWFREDDRVSSVLLAYQGGMEGGAAIAELLTGKVPGREREEEIIVSTHMGMGAHDVCCADIVYRRALERGMGQMLQLT